MNHIFILSADHCNTIFIDRVLSKTNIGWDSSYFNNSFLDGPKFLFHLQKGYFLDLIIWKIITFPQLACCSILSPPLKSHASSFSRNSTTHESFSISRLRKKLTNLYKSKNFKLEIKAKIRNWKKKVHQLKS